MKNKDHFDTLGLPTDPLPCTARLAGSTAAVLTILQPIPILPFTIAGPRTHDSAGYPVTTKDGSHGKARLSIRNQI
jgi:hypothetical protein